MNKGPVVLYFYPAAFTSGCTVEAHEFADAIDQYAALGATVIGVSHDPIDTLQKFSVSECRSKFAVAADTNQAVMKEYDAVLAQHPQYANRTSYVIAPDGTIIYTYTSLDPVATRLEHAGGAEDVEGRPQFGSGAGVEPEALAAESFASFTSTDSGSSIPASSVVAVRSA